MLARKKNTHTHTQKAPQFITPRSRKAVPFQILDKIIYYVNFAPLTFAFGERNLSTSDIGVGYTSLLTSLG